MPRLLSVLPRDLAWSAYTGLLIALAWFFFADLRHHLLDTHDAEMFLDHLRIDADPAFFFSATKHQASGRPIAEFVKYLIYCLWGNDVGAFHLAVVVFHTLAAILLARLTALLCEDRPLGFCTGLLFLANVTHFQAVHHISALDYPLALCLATSALLVWHSRQSRPWGRMQFSFLLSLGLLSHLSALFIWPLALAATRRRGPPSAVRQLWPTLIVPATATAISVALTSRATSTWRSLDAYGAEQPLDLALGALRVMAWLAGRLFTTAHWLPIPLYEQAAWELWCGLFVVIGLAILAFRGAKIPRWAAAWTLLGLVPFGLLNSGTILGLPAGPSRYLYMASAGSSILLAWPLSQLGRSRWRPVSWLLAVLLIANSYISLQKVEAISYYTSGRHYIAAGDIAAGIAQFRRAIARAPDVIDLEETYFRLAYSLPYIGADPAPVLREALRNFPDNWGLLLADAITAAEGTDEAGRQRGIRMRDVIIAQATGAGEDMRKNAAAFYNNMGYGLAQKDQFERAQAAFITARHYAPGKYSTLKSVSRAYSLAGIKLTDQEQISAAKTAYRKALGHDPDNAAARVNLGWLLFLEGQHQVAAEFFVDILARERNSLALFNLALVYLAAGDAQAARSTYAQAVDEFGAEEARRIGAVADLRHIADQGPFAAEAQGLLDLYWPEAAP